MHSFATGDNMCECKHCRRKFPTACTLRRHISMSHGTEIPFLCDTCGFQTKYFKSMIFHKKRHNGRNLLSLEGHVNKFLYGKAMLSYAHECNSFFGIKQMYKIYKFCIFCSWRDVSLHTVCKKVSICWWNAPSHLHHSWRQHSSPLWDVWLSVEALYKYAPSQKKPPWCVWCGSERITDRSLLILPSLFFSFLRLHFSYYRHGLLFSYILSQKSCLLIFHFYISISKMVPLLQTFVIFSKRKLVHDLLLWRCFAAGTHLKCPTPGCSFQSARQKRLDDHIYAQQCGIRKHMCSTCGKSFNLHSRLKRHEAVHESATIFCTDCNYKTRRRDNLRAHVRKYHPQSFALLLDSGAKLKSANCSVGNSVNNGKLVVATVSLGLISSKPCCWC